MRVLAGFRRMGKNVKMEVGTRRSTVPEGQIRLDVDRVEIDGVLFCFMRAKSIIGHALICRPKHPGLGENSHLMSEMSALMEKHPQGVERLFWRYNLEKRTIIGPARGPLPERPVDWKIEYEFLHREGDETIAEREVKQASARSSLIELMRGWIAELPSGGGVSGPDRDKDYYPVDNEWANMIRLLEYMGIAAPMATGHDSAVVKMPWRSFVGPAIYRRCLENSGIEEKIMENADRASHHMGKVLEMADIGSIALGIEKSPRRYGWDRPDDVDRSWAFEAQAWAAVISIGMGGVGGRLMEPALSSELESAVETYEWMFDIASAFHERKAAELVTWWAEGMKPPLQLRCSTDHKTYVHIIVPEGIEGVSNKKNPASAQEVREWMAMLLKAHGDHEKAAENMSFITHKLAGTQEMTYQGAYKKVQEVCKECVSTGVGGNQVTNIVVVLAPAGMAAGEARRAIEEVRRFEALDDDSKLKVARETRETIRRANANVLWVGPGNFEENGFATNYRAREEARELMRAGDAMDKLMKKSGIITLPWNVMHTAFPRMMVEKGKLYINTGRTFGFWAQILFISMFGMMWPTPRDMELHDRETPAIREVISEEGRDSIGEVGIWLRRWIDVANDDRSLKTKVRVPETKITGVAESLRTSDRQGVYAEMAARIDDSVWRTMCGKAEAHCVAARDRSSWRRMKVIIYTAAGFHMKDSEYQALRAMAAIGQLKAMADDAEMIEDEAETDDEEDDAMGENRPEGQSAQDEDAPMAESNKDGNDEGFATVKSRSEQKKAKKESREAKKRKELLESAKVLANERQEKQARDEKRRCAGEKVGDGGDGGAHAGSKMEGWCRDR